MFEEYKHNRAIRKARAQKEAIIRARQDERAKTTEERNAYWKRKLDELTIEFQSQLTRKDAEIENLQLHYKVEFEKIRDADRVHRECWEQIDSNVALAGQLVIYANRFRDVILDVAKKAEGLNDKAIENKQTMEIKDTRFRRKLDLVPKNVLDRR